MLILCLVIFDLVSSMCSTRSKVLVIGGSGRVGGSAVRALAQKGVQVTVGGRSQSNFEAFLKRNKMKNIGFQEIDINDETVLDTVIPNFDLIVHTAGPFQGLTEPNVLMSSLKHGKKYVDVMDDISLSRIARSKKYQEMAKSFGGRAVVSAGIWPGGSSLLAQQSIANIGLGKAKKVVFDFFTAGSGNAGTTIITATFLILGENVLTYQGGKAVYKKSATDMKSVDFGPGVGKRDVVRLNLIECESCFVSSEGKLDVETYFGTAPRLWNSLFALMANAIPQKFLQNRDAMTKLAVFSMPMIRLIDLFVGSRNSIKVTIETDNGQKRSALMTHDDLEAAVGDSLSSFVVRMLPSENGVEPDILPGVYYPEEMPEEYRDQVLKDISNSAIYFKPIQEAE